MSNGGGRGGRFQEALLELLAAHEDDFDARLMSLVRADAQGMGVERVSYWSLRRGGEAIGCETLYRSREDDFQAGLELEERDFPRYFTALRTGRAVVASDAHTHEATFEFSTPYLRPHGIGAMLDVPVYARGALVGVLCHEHVGGPRDWTTDEANFAMSVGQLVALAIEARHRTRIQEALHLSEARIRHIFEAVPVPMLVAQLPDGVVLQANRALSDLSGLSREQLIGKRTPDYYADPKDRDAVLADLMASGHVRDREVLLRRGDGTPFWGLLNLQMVDLDEGKASVVSIVDVTERRRMEEALRWRALHDPLTDLPNRAAFFEALRREIARGRRTDGNRFAVLFLDLDGFKEVNDALGHEAGDFLLRHVSRQLRSALREMDLPARLGGDEFTALVVDAPPEDETRSLAQRVLESIQTPARIAGQDVTPAASLGVYLGTAVGRSADDVVRLADAAMYAAKRQGGKRIAFADAALPARPASFDTSQGEA